jgi:kynurenine 3-monooxygenase
MRHLVITPMYIFKKALDNILYSLTHRTITSLSSLTPLLAKEQYATGEPSGWLPLYTMVTFRPDISYAVVKRKAERQSRVLTFVGWTAAALLGAAGLQTLRVAKAALRR